MPVVSAPLEALAAFGFILAGVPVYFVTQREARERIPGLGWLGKLFSGGSRAGTSALSGQSVGRRKGRDAELEHELVGEEDIEEEAVEMLPRESESKETTKD